MSWNRKQKHSLVEEELEPVPPVPVVKPVEPPSIKPLTEAIRNGSSRIGRARLPEKYSKGLREWWHGVWTGEKPKVKNRNHKPMLDLQSFGGERINPVFPSDERLKFHQKRKTRL